MVLFVWDGLVEREAVGVEPVRLFPQFWGAVEVPYGDEHVIAFVDGVATDVVVFEGAADEDGGLGVKAHGLVDDAGSEGQVAEVFHGGEAVAEDGVNL